MINIAVEDREWCGISADQYAYTLTWGVKSFVSVCKDQISTFPGQARPLALFHSRYLMSNIFPHP